MAPETCRTLLVEALAAARSDAADVMSRLHNLCSEADPNVGALEDYANEAIRKAGRIVLFTEALGRLEAEGVRP